ncbi:MAG: hypothetical protein PVG66_00880 [Chromatiales bacterium]|jgi:hypothetical protein
MKNNPINWNDIKRGVPITNDSFFVRLDPETGFIFDDRGGFMHQTYCSIDTRREITWIEQTGDKNPVAYADTVIVEYPDGKLVIKKAGRINWSKVFRYRVVKQS